MLNWTIHRIWSTDWFRNPARELKKVVDAIACAKDRMTKPVETDTERSAPESENVDEIPAAEVLPPLSTASASGQRSAVKYEMAKFQINLGNTELHLVSARQLSAWVSQVVDIESPVFWLEATRRVAAAAGVARVGGRIQEAFERALETGSRWGRFKVKDGFLWKTGMEIPAIRDRSDLSQACKKIDYVAPEEIREAILQVARDSFGGTPIEIVHGACRLLGFGRVTDDVRAVIDKNRDALVAAGVLEQRGESLIAASESG